MLIHTYGLPWWLSGKVPTCQCRRWRFDSWLGKIPWKRKWQPSPVLLLGESHGQRSLAGYSLAAAAAAAKSLQSCPTLCDPTDGSPPGFPVPGILQARTLDWVAISFSNAWKWKVESEVAQSCLTLHNTMDHSLPGSSIHGVFQARVLDSFSLLSFS